MANLAHDINNPLSIISGSVMLLQRDIAALAQVLGLYHQADQQIEHDQPGLYEKIRAVCKCIDGDLTADYRQGLFARMCRAIKRMQEITQGLGDSAGHDRGDPREAAPDGSRDAASAVTGDYGRREQSLR